MGKKTVFLMNILEPSVASWWTGVSDIEVEGRYVDILNNEITFTDWFEGYATRNGRIHNAQPTGQTKQNCIELRRMFTNITNALVDAGKHYWNDAECSGADRHYICRVKDCGLSPSPRINCSSGQTQSAYGCQFRGKRLNTEALSVLTKASASACLLACFQEPSCESANFHRSTHKCALSKTRVQNTIELQASQEYDFLSSNLC
ncbi:hypothetical protein CAPTEDRAFT_203811 [Capitella teleta]|uniref:Apple domain-containing protein n=1 Tax=Capitella teleta TaxID=283909 RepID=R7UIB6_CAPTE|nr:hypothetical protein CAPTEDRAFT_203811 [Capitella teleta]|eukprot:ELU02992.1 hypothetical protein CAPTEDRAFT_203811 [Capitella teleta]